MQDQGSVTVVCAGSEPVKVAGAVVARNPVLAALVRDGKVTCNATRTSVLWMLAYLGQ